MLNKIIMSLGIFFLLNLSFFLQAKTPHKSPEKRKKKQELKTEFSFEGTTIQGERTAPLGTVLDEASPDLSYNFVTIRKNWRHNILKSLDSLQVNRDIFNKE